MYNVTDNAYTRTELAAGAPAPNPKTQMNAIHDIFQKIHNKQFKLPESPITAQAQLKRDAFQACRDDLKNHWGITKFFIFLLSLTPFKFDIQKKADQILKDTGRLHLKARELGCTDGKGKEYVTELNTAWLSRPQRPETIEALPNAFKELYRSPHTSLEEFLEELDNAENSDLMLIKEELSDPANNEHPFSKLMTHKTKEITDLEKAAFILKDANIPDLDINGDILQQIHDLPDEELRRLVLGIPEDEGHPLILAALREYSSRILIPADNPGVYLIPADLKLSDEEKSLVAKQLHNVYQKLGSQDFPSVLINKLDLKNDKAIKDLKFAAQVKGAQDTHKLDDNFTNLMGQVSLDKQKELEALAEKNDTGALIEALKKTKDEDKINYMDVLSSLLKNKKTTAATRIAIALLFDKIGDDQKPKAFGQLSKNDLLPQLLPISTLNKLPNNADGVAYGYLNAFKKLVEKSPNGFANATLAQTLLLKMSPEERKNAFEHILSKSNPLLYLYPSLIEEVKEEEDVPYDKIADIILKQPIPTPQQVKLFRIAIERMQEDDQQAYFGKMIESKSRITFSMLKENLAEPLQSFKVNFLKQKDLKGLLEKRQKYADLLIATNSQDKFLEIYEVADKNELLKKLGEKKESLNLLKFLIVRKVIDENLLSDHIDDFSKEVQEIIRKDKILGPLSSKEAP